MCAGPGLNLQVGVSDISALVSKCLRAELSWVRSASKPKLLKAVLLIVAC